MSQNVPPRPGLPRNNSYSSCTSTVELISDGTISWTLASLFKIPPPPLRFQSNYRKHALRNLPLYAKVSFTFFRGNVKYHSIPFQLNPSLPLSILYESRV